MWYDDEGKPVTRAGVHLPRPCPPACHRCEKSRLGIESLSRQNLRLLDLHTDNEIGVLNPAQLSDGERQALRLIHHTLTQAERKRLAADIAEVLNGRL